MLFEGDEDNFVCDYCYEEFPDDFRSWNEDENVCKVCAHKQYLAWREEPCAFCGKPMKEDESDPVYNNATDQSAHGKCFEKNEGKIPEDELDEWCRAEDMY